MLHIRCLNCRLLTWNWFGILIWVVLEAAVAVRYLLTQTDSDADYDNAHDGEKNGLGEERGDSDVDDDDNVDVADDDDDENDQQRKVAEKSWHRLVLTSILQSRSTI